MPGYSKDIFIDGKKLHQRLLCVMCKHVLRNAVQSTCGHRCCEDCVKQQLQEKRSAEDPARCPACPDDSEESVLQESQIYPDFHARKELKALQVKCSNEGCKWKGTFQEYSAEHEPECEFETLKCLKAGCGKALRRADLAYHLEKDCPMRPVRCGNCGKEMIYKNLKKHNTECPKMPVTCKDCGKKILRESLRSHQDIKTGNCKNKKQHCPFAALGCSFKISGGSGLNEHLINELPNHTQLQIDKIESLIEHYEASLASRSIISSLQGDENEHGEEHGACADPKVSSLPSLSGKQLDQMVTIFKQWFVLRAENGGDEAGKSRSSPTARRAISNGNDRELIETTIKDLENKVKKSEEELNKMRTLYAVLDKRNETFQEVVAVLNNQLEAVAEKTGALERENRHLQEVINQQERQIHAHDQMLTVKNVALAEQELRIQSLESSSYNGILVWKITELARKRRDAISGKTTSFYSQPFYTSYHGYKMRARLYLNGDGMGKGTHLSLFFVVMKGRYDNVLRWPFRQKVTFMLVDQGNKEHVVDAFRPDPTSSSFKKPTSEMNIASGCPLFVNLNQLQSDQYTYIKDDCLFVKVIVDITDLERM